MGHTKVSQVSVGMKFHQLTIISEVYEEFSPSGASGKKVLCKCDCGVEKVIFIYNVIRGLTKSCGCLLHNKLKKHGQYKTETYSSWRNMIRRCFVEKGKYFKHYGARGITVCDRWRSYELFYEDMGKRPSRLHSIDRIDVNGNYEPGNCRWATQKEQLLNTRVNHVIQTPDGPMTVSQAADFYGINRSTIYNRLARGKTDEEALRKPR